MTLPFLYSLLVLTVPALAAKSPQAAADEDRGFTLYEHFSGSANRLGQIMKFDTSIGYNYNRFFGLEAGLPVYVVRPSAASMMAGSTSSTGIGDVYLALRLTARSPVVSFASRLTGRAPTGDTSAGFSTGRATFDWSNYVGASVSRLRPFVVLGVGNSISDTHFFTRPFASLGMLAHFEGGATYLLLPFTSVGASAYDVMPWGQQKVFSKLVRPGTSSPGTQRRRGGVFENASQTVGGPEITQDNGFSAWLAVSPLRQIDLEVGYDRSVPYDLNTLSFGIGLNLGSAFKLARRL